MQVNSALSSASSLLSQLYSTNSNGNSSQSAKSDKSSSQEASANPFDITDSFDLNTDAASTVKYAQAKFQLNYQAIQAVSNSQGFSVKQTSFSFSASFEFLQVASGNAPTDVSNTDSTSLVDKLKELFSPENTAQRILDFALSFAPADADEAGRQEFADYIGAAIQKGFDQAQAILGKVDDEIQSGIDQTHEIVFKGLADYVKSGLAANQEEKTSAIQAYAQYWKAEVSMSYSSTSITYDQAAEADDAADSSAQSQYAADASASV